MLQLKANCVMIRGFYRVLSATPLPMNSSDRIYRGNNTKSRIDSLITKHCTHAVGFEGLIATKYHVSDVAVGLADDKLFPSCAHIDV